MEPMPSDRQTRPYRRSRRLGAASLLWLLMLFVSGTAWGQRVRVAGTVKSEGGTPLAGVTVRVQGTDSVTVTNDAGRYQITTPTGATLQFNLIGYRRHDSEVNGRTLLDVTMERLAVLDQIVVTAYSGEQRRSEITGAVASVNVAAAERQTSASVLQKIDASVPGVQVANSGSPGGRSTVRIRGISSFQNNDTSTSSTRTTSRRFRC
jgi:hypothetical protein